MKARVKAMGKIVEVITVADYINENGQIIGEYKDANGMLYTSYDLDFYIEEGITIPDYWTRLEHQAAIGAMQGILSNPEVYLDYKSDECMPQAVAATAYIIANALVGKMKEAK